MQQVALWNPLVIIVNQIEFLKSKNVTFKIYLSAVSFNIYKENLQRDEFNDQDYELKSLRAVSTSTKLFFHSQ